MRFLATLSIFPSVYARTWFDSAKSAISFLAFATASAISCPALDNGTASSTIILTLSGVTSTYPQLIATNSSPLSFLISITPAFRVETNGACPSRTPNSPSSQAK